MRAPRDLSGRPWLADDGQWDPSSIQRARAAWLAAAEEGPILTHHDDGRRIDDHPRHHERVPLQRPFTHERGATKERGAHLRGAHRVPREARTCARHSQERDRGSHLAGLRQPFPPREPRERGVHRPRRDQAHQGPPQGVDGARGARGRLGVPPGERRAPAAAGRRRRDHLAVELPGAARARAARPGPRGGQPRDDQAERAGAGDGGPAARPHRRDVPARPGHGRHGRRRRWARRSRTCRSITWSSPGRRASGSSS